MSRIETKERNAIPPSGAAEHANEQETISEKEKLTSRKQEGGVVIRQKKNTEIEVKRRDRKDFSASKSEVKVGEQDGHPSLVAWPVRKGKRGSANVKATPKGRLLNSKKIHDSRKDDGGFRRLQRDGRYKGIPYPLHFRNGEK